VCWFPWRKHGPCQPLTGGGWPGPHRRQGVGGIKGAGIVGAVRVNPNHTPPLNAATASSRSDDLAGLARSTITGSCPPSCSSIYACPMVTSFGAKLYPLPFFFLGVAPPLLNGLAPGVESQYLGVWPLPVGVAKRASCRMMRLPHGLFRSGGIPDPDGPALLRRGTDGGGTVCDTPCL
jgi:hypothetical protein